MSTRILFVDDEPNVLRALQMQLRRQREVWEMTFVGHGRAALDVLATTEFDVVVTDMRMPELDGAELIRQIHARWPRVACFVLSGYADPDLEDKVRPIARAFLSKPCDTATLVAAIEGAR